MNRTLPPGDCGTRGSDPGRAPGPRWPVPGIGRLVGGVAATACRPDKEKPPRGFPGGCRRPASSGSGFDGIAALSVFAFRGFYRQAQLLTNPGQEAPHGMRLPAGGLHQFLQGCAIRPLQQVQDLLGLTDSIQPIGKLVGQHSASQSHVSSRPLAQPLRPFSSS